MNNNVNVAHDLSKVLLIAKSNITKVSVKSTGITAVGLCFDKV